MVHDQDSEFQVISHADLEGVEEPIDEDVVVGEEPQIERELSEIIQPILSQ
jgi:hypothetical protein